jgi:hypothetical protein
MILDIIKRIFRKKKTEYKPYIEHDTECDKCEFLEQCKDDGYVINCTTYYDSRQHFIRGLGSNCRK